MLLKSGYTVFAPCVGLIAWCKPKCRQYEDKKRRLRGHVDNRMPPSLGHCNAIFIQASAFTALLSGPIAAQRPNQTPPEVNGQTKPTRTKTLPVCPFVCLSVTPKQQEPRGEP